MSGHTPGPLPKILRTEECAAGSRYAVGVHSGEVLFNDRAAFAAEIARRWNAHADLVAALLEAQRSLAAVAGLLATYPRSSNDPHGRALLDSMEHAKAASHAARAAVAKAGGA